MASEKGIRSLWLLHKSASLNNKSMVSILKQLEKYFLGNRTVEFNITKAKSISISFFQAIKRINMMLLIRLSSSEFTSVQSFIRSAPLLP